MDAVDEDDEREEGRVGLGRTLALSDGIFAIAMTLVAFQIQAPNLQGGAVHHLAHALGKMGADYYVFALTFFVIGGFWLGHHRLFRQLRRADEGFMSLNLVFLATIALLPFPSSVMGRYGGQASAVILYATNMIAVGLLLGLLTLVAQHRNLLADSMTPAGVRRALWRSGWLVAVFAASIPVALVDANIAPFVWLAILPMRLIGRLVGDRPRS
ncbi:MAG TPA: TMEM175 family protein [Actinomycetota bacterium]|nr:TMEM175 family protein [Actinomycetota bacterium]